MKTTKNFFLKIFEGLDNFDYKTINENWEKIDNALDELLNGGNEVILPTITIERIENGYRITTHDAKGSQSFELTPYETGVVEGVYGGFNTSANIYNIPNVTVDKYGRVTEASNSVLPPATSGLMGLVTPNLYKSFKLQSMLKEQGIIRTYDSSTGENTYSYGGTYVYAYSVPGEIATDIKGLPKVANLWVIAPYDDALLDCIKIKANIAMWRSYDSKGQLCLFIDILNKSEIEEVIEKVQPIPEHITYCDFLIEYWVRNTDEDVQMTM